MMTTLSEHFSLAEFEKSQTALRHGIDNQVPADYIYRVRDLCDNVLEPVRCHFGLPVVISSGWRGPVLNAKVGGEKNSQHCKAYAADIEIPRVSNYDLALWIKQNLSFDQLILEYYTPGQPNSGWVHVSYVQGINRLKVLTKQSGQPYVRGLIR